MHGPVMCVDHNNVCVYHNNCVMTIDIITVIILHRERENRRQQDAVSPCLGLVSAVYSDT